MICDKTVGVARAIAFQNRVNEKESFLLHVAGDIFWAILLFALRVSKTQRIYVLSLVFYYFSSLIV